MFVWSSPKDAGKAGCARGPEERDLKQGTTVSLQSIWKCVSGWLGKRSLDSHLGPAEAGRDSCMVEESVGLLLCTGGWGGRLTFDKGEGQQHRPARDEVNEHTMGQHKHPSTEGDLQSWGSEIAAGARCLSSNTALTYCLRAPQLNLTVLSG